MRDVDLTQDEVRVLRLVAKGASAAEAARRLGISHSVAKRLVQHATIKLGAEESREAALERARSAGLL